MAKTHNILLVEDNPGDVRLIKEVLAECEPPPELLIIKDGEKAINYLKNLVSANNSELPDLIMLDLNLPLIDGREVLAYAKGQDRLKRVPVVIFSSSEAGRDVIKCYDLHANCYVVKPFDFKNFSEVVHGIYNFWLQIAKQPN